MQGGEDGRNRVVRTRRVRLLKSRLQAKEKVDGYGAVLVPIVLVHLNREAVKLDSPGQAQRRPGLTFRVRPPNPERVPRGPVRPLQGRDTIIEHRPRASPGGYAALACPGLSCVTLSASAVHGQQVRNKIGTRNGHLLLDRFSGPHGVCRLQYGCCQKTQVPFYSSIASCNLRIARIQSICTAGRERPMRSATSSKGNRWRLRRTMTS